MRVCIKAFMCLALLTAGFVGVKSQSTKAANLDEPASKAYSTVLFAGGDGQKNSYYTYAGGIYAFNGNLAYDGLLFRTTGLYGDYDYSSTAVVGGRVDADVINFNAMVGYQKFLHPVFARLYVGVEVSDHNLSPNNPLDKNRGTDVGFKIQGEIETYYSSPIYGNLVASFGTAKESYWARGRVGYNTGNLIIGPEALLVGDQEYDEQRVGGFATLRDFGLGATQFSVALGYSDRSRSRGKKSVYGTIEVSTAF